MVSYNTSKENLEACKKVSVYVFCLVQLTLAFIYCVVVVLEAIRCIDVVRSSCLPLLAITQSFLEMECILTKP